MSRALPDNEYPDALISGAPIAGAMRSVSARLQATFGAVPGVVFDYVPPRPTARDWERLMQRTPLCAVGWESFNPVKGVGASYEGDLVLTAYLTVKQQRRDALYFGDGKVPGLLGMMTIAARMLHGFVVAGVGTCRVAHVVPVMQADWLAQDMAMGLISIVIPNVGFDRALSDQLSDFLRLQEAFIVDGDVQPTVTLDLQTGTQS